MKLRRVRAAMSRPKKKKLTPYQKIARNARNGKGVVLDPDEVFQLSIDTAIETRAQLDDENDAGYTDQECI
jgi:hypothetical protein